MRAFFGYWLYPNLGTASYSNPKVMVLLGVSVGLIVVSFLIRFWRKTLKNPVTRRLTSGWPTAAFWFGAVALFLTVSRAEGILFLSMRVNWVLWGLALALYLVLQVLNFRRRHYTVLEKRSGAHPMDKYLPRKKN